MNRDQAAVQAAMNAFRYQLDEERDKGMADGARMFIARFEQEFGVQPVTAVEYAERGVVWGNAAMEYIAKLEDENAALKEEVAEAW